MIPVYWLVIALLLGVDIGILLCLAAAIRRARMAGLTAEEREELT